MKKNKNIAKWMNEMVREYEEKITIVITNSGIGFSILALNEDGETLAFGVEHALDEAFWEQFAPKLYKHFEIMLKNGDKYEKQNYKRKRKVKRRMYSGN